VRAGGAQQLSGGNENAAIGLFSDGVVAQNGKAAYDDKQWECDEENPYWTAISKCHSYKTIEAILQGNERLVTVWTGSRTSNGNAHLFGWALVPLFYQGLCWENQFRRNRNPSKLRD
jgi:hypothetical protein